MGINCFRRDSVLGSGSHKARQMQVKELGTEDRAGVPGRDGSIPCSSQPLGTPCRALLSSRLVILEGRGGGAREASREAAGMRCPGVICEQGLQDCSALASGEAEPQQQLHTHFIPTNEGRTSETEPGASLEGHSRRCGDAPGWTRDQLSDTGLFVCRGGWQPGGWAGCFI